LVGDVNPLVIFKLVADQVVVKFSLCNAKFDPLASTKRAGQPAVPPLV
jgi:hypothetical protein